MPALFFISFVLFGLIRASYNLLTDKIFINLVCTARCSIYGFGRLVPIKTPANTGLSLLRPTGGGLWPPPFRAVFYPAYSQCQGSWERRPHLAQLGWTQPKLGPLACSQRNSGSEQDRMLSQAFQTSTASPQPWLE